MLRLERKERVAEISRSCEGLGSNSPISACTVGVLADIERLGECRWLISVGGRVPGFPVPGFPDAGSRPISVGGWIPGFPASESDSEIDGDIDSEIDSEIDGEIDSEIESERSIVRSIERDRS